ncbi:FkbM family methyltransferase [Fundidesulfovibrio terrae]|uniref:FkbM family methyltransferase n=1 Tax=Fundidesulfovibrio terrae TaxID=2922866 RepID=UPI001FAFFFE6|nr:FkbM family methyltransferase [Fundidesulfovibrio terrae]
MLDDILRTASARPFNPFEEELPGEFVVFGTGARGRRCRRRLESMGIRVPCFADNNPRRQGTNVDGLPVTAPAQIAVGAAVLICSFAHQAIFAQLFSMGFRNLYRDDLAERPPLRLLRENAGAIEQVLASLSDRDSRDTYADVLRLRFHGTPLPRLSDYPMYGHPLVLARSGDCIVDGGAASGDSIALFRSQAGPDCRIYAFEPTPASFQEMVQAVEKAGQANVHPVNMALWNHDGQVGFFEAFAMSHGNRIGGEGGITVDATTLDSFVERRGIDKVDLIKLDIEGAELAALEGAQRTIRRFRPRLQICLYHKPCDLWELPLFVRELVPGYRCFVGHHSHEHLDTVLYCLA